jgi:hypothetical protein
MLMIFINGYMFQSKPDSLTERSNFGMCLKKHWRKAVKKMAFERC